MNQHLTADSRNSTIYSIRNQGASFTYGLVFGPRSSGFVLRPEIVSSRSATRLTVERSSHVPGVMLGRRSEIPV